MASDDTTRLSAEVDPGLEAASWELLFEGMPRGAALLQVEVDEAGAPAELVILRLNRALEQAAGIRRATVVGRGVGEVVPGLRELEPGFVPIVGHVGLTGEPREFDLPVTPTGRLYSLSAYRFRPGIVVVLFEDRTDRRRIEEALRENERRMSTLLAHLPGMAYRCRNDREWTMEFVSGGSRQLCGFNPADLQWNRVLSYADLILDEDRARVWAGVQAALEQNEPFRMSYRIRHASGEVRWVFESGRGVFDIRNRLVAIEGFITDITPVKAAEDSLRAEKERARRYLEIAGVMLVGLDPDGRVSLINRKGCELLGWTEADLIGRDWFECCIPDAERPAARESFARLIEEGTDPVESEEGNVRTRTGSVRLVRWRHALLCDASGAVVGTLASGEDITDRRRLEGLFLHAQKMEVVGRLAGGVAHDFNNVLTVIRNYAELVHEGLPGVPSLRADIEELLDATDRAAAMTSQLLAFSRRQVVQPQVVDLSTALVNMSRMLRRLVPEEIDIVVSPGGTLFARIDPAQFDQVVLNLVVNARDASSTGGRIQVSLDAYVREEAFPVHGGAAAAGRWAMLSVADTGHGMSPDVMARLFEPFFTTKAVGRGTGLGLATVNDIVRQAEGHMAVESTPGRGSTFRVLLPAIDNTAGTRTSAPGMSGPAGYSGTLLLVEDEDSLGLVLARRLERLGYRVKRARDGREAMAMVRHAEAGFDLVVTDFILPGMRGTELIRKLRGMRPDLLFLITSGYADDIDSLAAEAGGPVPFLAKPCSIETLADRIREILEEGRRGARSPVVRGT